MLNTFSKTLQVLFLSVVFLSILGGVDPNYANGASLQLTWADNSTDEIGFHIERKLGLNGTYANIATVGTNVTSYNDSSLADNSTYCFRVNAFNNAGNSPYSPEVCSTTPAAPTTSYDLTASIVGNGTVTTNPAGINCGATCVKSFTANTVVTLIATPSTGYTFASWGGDNDCADGSVTVNANKTCIATFTTNPITPTSYLLTVTKVGTGTGTSNPASTVTSNSAGTVTSNPAGIDCGATCSKSFTSATVITLTATPATGYSFSGWSGDSDCTDGSVTANANKSCTATFTANPVTPTSYLLTVSAVGTISGAGTGSGKVVSSPAGIDCGSKCSASFSSGSAVTLQPVAATGSLFSGWSGDADCLDGSVTMTAAKTCSASFKLISYGLTVSLTGTGTGKVVSDVTGINCGIVCGAEYAKDRIVKLTPTPSADSFFSGWSGDADCLDGSLTINASKSCTATFSKRAPTNIGLFRPGTGNWFLIANSSGTWQGCNVDHCISQFGNQGARPVVGDWNGNGNANVGVYDPNKKTWELDINNSSSWQGCGTDSCASFSVATNNGEKEIPITGRWSSIAKDALGLFQFVQTSQTTKTGNSRWGSTTKTVTNTAGYWYLDKNGNGKFDGCSIDLCYGPFGQKGDVPVTGDWDASGTTKIGVFTPQTGMWTLDVNNNGKVDSCTIDKCFGPFGSAGDIPVSGDWSGTGTAKIGVFRAATGEWFLDLNGNGKWDGCDVDKCVTGFGQAGDLPVVGKW